MVIERGDNIEEKVEKIAKETHISQKYLEALEEEEFSIFPGEPYLKGFLRTYSIYLNLDPDEMVRIYEKIKMAETPTPSPETSDQPKKKPSTKDRFRSIREILGIYLTPILILIIFAMISIWILGFDPTTLLTALEAVYPWIIPVIQLTIIWAASLYSRRIANAIKYHYFVHHFALLISLVNL